MEKRFENGTLTIFIADSLTADNAEKFFNDVNSLCSSCHDYNSLVINADGLKCISSAGLKILLKLSKLNKDSGKNFSVQDVPPEIYNVFKVAGFNKLMTVIKKLREISINDCPLIGEGRSSKVFRIDPETVVKCFYPNVRLDNIIHELEMDKKVFLLDIPTAISYDLVKIGDSYGAVFELIAADTVGHAITNNIDKFDEITKKFADLYKKIHSTKLKADSGFPSVKTKWLDWLDGMKNYYTSEEFDFMNKMLDSIPERYTMIHCDFHENNVLYQNGELIIIDMADVGFGHPILDLAGGAFRTHCSIMPDRKATHGLSPENMLRFWDTVLKFYFDIDDNNLLNEIKEVCEAFGFLRSALFPMKHSQISESLRNWHINDARKFLFSRKDWVLEQTRKLPEIFN